MSNTSSSSSPSSSARTSTAIPSLPSSPPLHPSFSPFYSSLQRYPTEWKTVNQRFSQTVNTFINLILQRGYLTLDQLPQYTETEIQQQQYDYTHNQIFPSFLTLYQSFLHEWYPLFRSLQSTIESLQSIVDNYGNRYLRHASIANGPSSPPSSLSTNLSRNMSLVLGYSERLQLFLTELYQMYASELTLKYTILTHLLPRDCTVPIRTLTNNQDNNNPISGHVENTVPQFCSSSESPSSSSSSSCFFITGLLPKVSENDKEYFMMQATAISTEVYVDSSKLSMLFEGIEHTLQQISTLIS